MSIHPAEDVSEIEIEIEAEIKRLHEFLANWFNGTLPAGDDIYADHFGDHLSADFVNIQPGGARLNRDQLNKAIIAGYGKNPDFKILIRNVEIRAVMDGGALIFATYEEYQKGARNSHAYNARVSTLLIEKRKAGGFMWHHIHETWLPEDHHGPEMFEF